MTTTNGSTCPILALDLGKYKRVGCVLDRILGCQFGQCLGML
jgi:hypothetical protein